MGKIVTDRTYNISLHTDASGCVAVGNPYLSMMSVQSFFSSNQSVESLTLDGIVYTSAGLSSKDGERMYIKPAEAFVIKTTSKSSSITVTFNAGDVYSESSSSVSSRATAGKMHYTCRRRAAAKQPALLYGSMQRLLTDWMKRRM